MTVFCLDTPDDITGFVSAETSLGGDDAFLNWTEHPLVLFAEFGLVFLLAVHIFGGLTPAAPSPTLADYPPEDCGVDGGDDELGCAVEPPKCSV